MQLAWVKPKSISRQIWAIRWWKSNRNHNPLMLKAQFLWKRAFPETWLLEVILRICRASCTSWKCLQTFRVLRQWWSWWPCYTVFPFWSASSANRNICTAGCKEGKICTDQPDCLMSYLHFKTGTSCFVRGVAFFCCSSVQWKGSSTIEISLSVHNCDQSWFALQYPPS